VTKKKYISNLLAEKTVGVILFVEDIIHRKIIFTTHTGPESREIFFGEILIA
jgi:hypothetical protein